MRLILFLCLLMLCGCGSTRTASPPTTRHEVEHDNPGWTIESEGATARVYDVAPVTRVIYRDYHWTWEAGYLHPAEHHTYYYGPDGRIVDNEP